MYCQEISNTDNSSCGDEEDDWDINWGEWMEDIARENDIDATQAHMASNLQRALPSLLSNNASQALISVPRTVQQHRLDPLRFRIAMCRRLRLPIHQKHRP
eukprot:12888090-Ditylum_brightwellii.AAC.1